MLHHILLDHQAKKVLSLAQQDLVPLLEEFSQTHFLAGGTAVALWIGQRESIDFDFFSRGSQGSFASFVEKIGVYTKKYASQERTLSSMLSL